MEFERTLPFGSSHALWKSFVRVAKTSALLDRRLPFDCPVMTGEAFGRTAHE